MKEYYECPCCDKAILLTEKQAAKHDINYKCPKCKKNAEINELLKTNDIDADAINNIGDEVFFAILRSRGYSGKLNKTVAVSV
jgi:phage FluMu protein Com